MKELSRNIVYTFEIIYALPYIISSYMLRKQRLELWYKIFMKVGLQGYIQFMQLDCRSQSNYRR